MKSREFAFHMGGAAGGTDRRGAPKAARPELVRAPEGERCCFVSLIGLRKF
jgi:hypothetical protein